MIAQFFDRQDTANPMNGTMLDNSDELRKMLSELRSRQPFFAELIGENGYKLLLGIGFSDSCVQHSSADGSAPYLMAVAVEAREGEVEFLIADTASPVPMRYCLSYETMVEIATHFLNSGERYPTVDWEEL